MLAFAIGVSAQVGAIDPHGEHPPSQGYGVTGPPSVAAATYGAAGEKKLKYTCPMHPEVVMDHPGNCPKCGMKLVPVAEKKRSTLNVESRGD